MTEKQHHIRLTRTINGSPRRNPDSLFESSAVKPIALKDLNYRCVYILLHVWLCYMCGKSQMVFSFTTHLLVFQVLKKLNTLKVLR